MASKARERSGAGRRPSPLDASPTHLLQRAVQRALDEYSAEFGPGGITQRQYAVLTAVADQEGATQTELVRTTGIDRSTLAELVARMMGKDLLVRGRSTADGRANAVGLTPKGQAALAEAQPKMAAADGKLLKLLGRGSRREAFVDLLLRLTRDEPTKPAKAKPAKDKRKKKIRADSPAAPADLLKGRKADQAA